MTKKTISFTIDSAFADKISRFCKKRGITRSFFLERSAMLGYILWEAKSLKLEKILEELKCLN